MSQPNEMSAEEFQQQYGKPEGPSQLSAATYQQQVGESGKKPDTYTADEYRQQHVDQNEHSLQALCVSWYRRAYPSLLLFAVPNAARRSPQLASMLEAEGLVSGIPDLVLAYPNGDYPGLYIEMKTRRKNSQPSPEQIKVQAYLRAVGYMVIMPRTFEEFQQQVNEYLTGYEHQPEKTGDGTPKMWRSLRVLRQAGDAETDAGGPHDAPEQPVAIGQDDRWRLDQTTPRTG